MKNLTIRVSDELHAEITEAAKRVELSINSLTCIALKRLLKELRDVKEEDGVIFLGDRKEAIK